MARAAQRIIDEARGLRRASPGGQVKRNPEPWPEGLTGHAASPNSGRTDPKTTRPSLSCFNCSDDPPRALPSATRADVAAPPWA